MIVFVFSHRSSSKAALFSLFTLIGATVPCGAQQVTAQAGAQVQAHPVAVSAGASVNTQTAACPPGTVQDDRLDRNTLIKRGLTLGVVGAGGAYATEKISGVAKSAVDFGKVRSVPHWGPAVASVPIFGKAAAGGKVIPTTLGQVPVMGAVVKEIPLAGPIIAGPANPILVGAVAVDNYVIPKYSPCGYTKSSVIAANNDFNTPPKLRYYVNYLAPLPYSHPPIYSPSTLKTDLPADLAYIDQISHSAVEDVVRVPEL